MERLKLLRSDVLFVKSQMHFNVYELENFDFTENLDFSKDDGNSIYIFSKRTKNSDGRFTHNIYYCGKTIEPSSRFYHHHKTEQLKDENPNCISIHHCQNKDEMDELEVQLIELYKPIYNKQHNVDFVELEKD